MGEGTEQAFVCPEESQRHITGGCSASFAFRWPGLALESVARREHARQPIPVANQSLGCSPAVPPAHARGHPVSIAVRGRGLTRLTFYVARLTSRCSGRALNALRLGALPVF